MTVAVFLPSLHLGFVSYDDPAYVVENPHLRPWSLGVVAWAFTQSAQGLLWIPLTFVSLALDEAVFGAGPFGHHLVNVLLHATATALVALLVLDLGAAPAGPGSRRSWHSLAPAALGALLFGLHPLRVESVSWVTERKDVLCAVFALLATRAWLRHRLGAGGRPWLAAQGWFLAALLSKPVAVTLPLLWALLDLALDRRPPWRRHLAELAPALAASVAVAVVTSIVQLPAIRDLAAAPLGARVLVALAAPARYLGLTVWPQGLHPYRPFPSGLELLAPHRLVAALATVALSAGAWALAGRARGPAIAWAAFVVALLPNIGLVQSGPQELAERFAYLASVPLALLAAAALSMAVASPRRAIPALAATTLVLVFLAVLTVRQQAHWRDSLAFWSRVAEQEPEAGPAWYEVASELVARGELEAALGPHSRSIELARRKAFPRLWRLLVERAQLLAALGRRSEALADAEEAVALHPSDETLALRDELRLAAPTAPTRRGGAPPPWAGPEVGPARANVPDP